MQIAIDKDVPLTSGRGNSMYPFKDMEVGDSFEVKLSDTRCTSLVGLQSSLSNSAVGAIGRGKTRTKMMPDRNSVRIWRVA